MDKIDPQSSHIQSHKDFSQESRKGELINALKAGKLSFQDLKEGRVTMRDLLENIPLNGKGIQELVITDVPTKSGQGSMRLLIKKEEVFDAQGDIVSTQLADPIYKERLKEFNQVNHYALEFIDDQRLTTSPEITQAKQELEMLEGLNELFNEYFCSFDPDDFFIGFTEAQKAFLGQEEREFTGTEVEINELYNLIKGEYPNLSDKILDLNLKIDSLQTQIEKPTITVRLSEGGEIGELKSVNIQSPEMSGNHLMQIFDNFLGFLGAQEMYLSDEAKFEKEGVGSYNMRLFRYFTTDDKSSWYVDSYGYSPYILDPLQNKIVSISPSDGDLIRSKSKEFSEKNLIQLKDELSQEGFDGTMKTKLLQVIEEHGEGCTTVGEIVKKLGAQAKGGSLVHQEIHALTTTYLELFRSYSGSDPAISSQKDQADTVLHAIYFRKSY
ncbi:MAG: hypothetical protein KDK96_10715 [Chlamydiia bacterium]|nr:hypothetical protein [Chlamydiia bacterium]MCB9093264.1 hypothetical protein [Halobacteriovoraceae bacterium]